MNNSVNMPDWHQYNPSQSGISDVTANGQNVNSSHLTFISTIGPPALNGYNVTAEGFDKHQNDTNFNSRHFQSLNPVTNVPNGTNNNPLTSMVQMQNCIGHYGSSGARNALDNLSGPIDPRNSSINALNEELGYRNNQIPMKGPVNHLSGPNLNVSGNNGSILPRHNSVNSTHSRQGPPSFIPCKGLCCNPDPNLSYQQWDKYPPYQTNAPYRDNIRSSGYQSENRRFGNEVNFRKDTYDNKEIIGTIPPNTDHRRNYPDYTKYRKDSMVSRTYPTSSGMLQNYTMQNYNYTGDYQKYSYAVKDYSKVSGMNFPNTSMLKHQEQNFMNQQKYNNKQVQYQNGAIMPKGMCAANMNSNVMPPVQNSYFNSQIPRNISTEIPHECQEATDTSMMTRMPCSPMHGNHARFQTYQQKIAMQRFSLESRLRELARIPGYQSHPKYKECILRYSEILKLQQSVGYPNTVQQTARVSTPVSTTVPPINLQFDQNGVLIHSNYLSDGFSRLAQIPNSEITGEISGKHSQEQVIDTSQMKNQNIQHTEQLNSSQNHCSPTLCAENIQQSHDNFSIRKNVEQQSQFKPQKNNTNIYNDLNNGSSNVATGEQKISKNFADKPELDVRQFLANWDESEDEEGPTSHLPEVNLNDSNQIVVAVNYDNPEVSSERSTETDISKRDNFDSTDATYENQDNTIGVITPNCLTVSYSSAENKESSPSCCEELATENIIKSGDIIHCISNGPDEIPTIHIVDNLEINNILEVTGEPVIKVLEGQESMSYFEQAAHMGASTNSIERDQLRKDEACKTLTVYRPPLDNLNKDTYISDVSDTTEKISSSVQQVDAQEIEVLPMSSKSSLDSSQGFRKQNSFTSEESHNPDDISLPDLPTSECTPISTTLNTPIHSDSEESSEQVEDLTISTNPIEVIQNSPMISFTHSPIKMDPYEHLDTIQGAKNKADISIASFHEGGQVKRNDMEHKTSEQVGVNRFDTSDEHNYEKTVERNANLSNRKASTSDDIQNQVNSVNVCLSPTSSEYDIHVTLVNAPQEITQDKDCNIGNDINEEQTSTNTSAEEQYNQSSTSTSSKPHSQNRDLHKSTNNKSELTTVASHSNSIYVNRTNIPKQLGPTKRIPRPEILTLEMSKHPAKVPIATEENQFNSTNYASSKEDIIEDVKIKNSESKRDCPMTLVKEISVKTNKQNIIEANQQQTHDRQQFIVSTTTENTNKEVEKSLHTMTHEKTHIDTSRKKTDHSSKESRVTENVANKKDCGRTIKEYKKTKTKLLYTTNRQNKNKQSNIISQHITESVNKSFPDVDEQVGKSVRNDQLIEDATKIESQESQQISNHAISLQKSPLPAVSYSIGIEDKEQQKKCAFSKSFVRNNQNSDFEIQVTNVNLKIKENDIRKELLNFRDKHQESVSEMMDAIKIHINVSCADHNTKEEVLPENAMIGSKQEVENCDMSISGNVDTSTQNARNLHISTCQENKIEDQVSGSSLDENNKNMLLENCASTTQCCTMLNKNKDKFETSMEHNIHSENHVDNTKTQQENCNTNMTKQTVTVVNVKHVKDGLFMNKVCHRALRKDATGEVMQCTNAHECTVEGSKSVKIIENISKQEIPSAVNKKNSELKSRKVVETSNNCPNASNKFHKDTSLNSAPNPTILRQTQNKDGKAVLDSFSLQPLLDHTDVQNSQTKDVNAILHISSEVKKLEGNRRTSSPILNITEISTESVNCDSSVNLDFDHFDIAPNENIDSEQLSKRKMANVKRKFSDMQLYNCSSGYVNPIFTSLEELENLNTVPVYTTKDGKITYSPNPRFTYRELILEARQREGHSSLRGSCYTNTLINDIHVSPKHKFLKKRYSFHTLNKKRQTLVSSGKKFYEQALKYYNTREDDNDENHRNYIHCVADHSTTHLEYYNNEADRKYNKNDYQEDGFSNKRHVVPSSTHGKKKEHTDDTGLNSKWERHKISHNLLLEKRNRKYVASETGLLLGNKGVCFDGSVEPIAVHALCNDKGKSQWNFLNTSIPECSKKQDDLSRNLTRKPYFNISELIPSYKICSSFNQNTCSLKNDATEIIDLHKTSTCADQKIEGVELSNSIVNNNNRNDNDNNTNDAGITMNTSEGGGSLKEEKHNIVNTTDDNTRLPSESNIAQGLFETTDHGFQNDGVVHIQNEESVISKVEIGNSNPDMKNKTQSDLNDSQKKGCEKKNDINEKNHESGTSKYTLHNTEDILNTSHAISENSSKRTESVQSVDTDCTSCKGNNGLNVINSALSESVVKDDNVEYSNFDADETNIVPEMQRDDIDNLNDSTNVLNIDSTQHNSLHVSSQKILSQEVNIQLEEIEHIKNMHVDQFVESKSSNNCLITFHTDIEQNKCDNQYCISNGNKCACSIVKTSECMLQNLHTSHASVSEILLTEEIVKTEKHVNESIRTMLTCEKVQINEFSRTSNMGLSAKNSLSTQNQPHDSDNTTQYDIIEKQIIKKDIAVDTILEKEKFLGNSVCYANDIIDVSANCSIPLTSKNKSNEDNRSDTTTVNFVEGTFKATELCTPIDKGSLNIAHKLADLATLNNKINVNTQDTSVTVPLTNSELLDAKIITSIQSKKELHTMVNKLQDVKKYTKLKSDFTDDCYTSLPNELDSLNDKNLLCNMLNKESSPYIYTDKNKHGPDTVSYDCNTKIVPKLVIKKTEINSNLVTLSSCDDEQNKNSEVGLKSALHPKIPKMIIRNARSRPGTPMIEEISESTSLKNQKIDHSIFEIRRQVSNDDYANKSDIVQESILLESKVPKVKIKLGNNLLKQSETCKQMEISVKRKNVKKAIPKVKIKKMKTQFKDNIDSEHNPAPVTIRTELLNKPLKVTSVAVDEMSNEDSEHKNNESSSESDRIYSNKVTSNCNSMQATEKDNNCSSQIDKDKLEMLLTDNTGRKWEKMPRVKFRKEIHNCLSCLDTRQSESITEIPSKRYRKSGKEDTRTMRNSGSIEMASIHNIKKEHVLCISEKIPKVIIKRSSASSEFKCELSKDAKNAIVKSAKWQPEVKLQRSQMLDHMVKNLKYSTVGVTTFKKDISSTHCSKPENIFDRESYKFGNKLCRSSSTSDLSPIKYKQRRMSDYNHSKFKDTETFSNNFCLIKTHQVSSNKTNTFGNIWSKENKSDNGDESHTCQNNSKNCVEKYTSCDEVTSNENAQHLRISDKTVADFQDSCSTSNLCDEEVVQVSKGHSNCFILNCTSDEIVSSTSPSANNNVETLKSIPPKLKDTSRIICSIPNLNDIYFAKSNISNNAKQVALTESENQLFIDQNKKINTLSLNGVLSITQGIKDENLPSKSVFESHNNHTIVEESILSEYNADSVSNLEDGIKTDIVPLSHHFNDNDDSVIKVDSSDESQTTIEILPASPDVNQIEISTCQLADVSEQLYSEDAIPTQFELELEVTDNSNVDFLDVPIPRVAEIPYHSTDAEYADGEDANIHCTLSYDISTKNHVMESYDGLNFTNTENCDKIREDQPRKANTKFLCCNDLFIKEVLAAKETLKKCFTKSKDENKKTNIPRPKTAAEKKQGSSFDLNSHTFTELNNTNHMYHSIPEVNPNVKLSASNQYKTELKPNVEKSDDRHSKQVKSSLMKKRIQVTNELDNNAGAEYSSMSFKSGLTTANEVTTISLKAFKRFGYDLVEKPTDITDKNKIVNKDNFRSHNLYNSVHVEKQIVQDIKEDTRIHKLPKISNCPEENIDIEETTKDIKSKEDNMPVLEPEVAVNFDPNSDRDSSRSPPVITNQDGIQANVDLKDSEEKVIMADDKCQRSKKYSDKKCEMTFADIVTQLAYHEKATIKHRRYCTLCERWFPTTSRHRRHLAGYQHRHIELTQRRTIHALFMLFTGRHCPRLLPTNIVRTDYTIGEPTPLQMAVQDVVKCLDPTQHDLNKHDNADL